MKIPHDAGLRLASMNAVLALLRAEQIAGIDGAEPGTADRQHTEFHPQLAGDDVHHLRLTAMRVVIDDALAAGTMHALANLRPYPCQRLVGKAQRARKGD